VTVIKTPKSARSCVQIVAQPGRTRYSLISAAA
jgi:hypothetical protein